MPCLQPKTPRNSFPREENRDGYDDDVVQEYGCSYYYEMLCFQPKTLQNSFPKEESRDDGYDVVTRSSHRYLNLRNEMPCLQPKTLQNSFPKEENRDGYDNDVDVDIV